MTSPPAVDIQVLGKVEALEQLLTTASRRLSRGRQLDELSDLRDAGLLFEITDRLRVLERGIVSRNTFFLRLVVEAALEDCHKTHGSISLPDFRKVLWTLLALRTQKPADHTCVVPTLLKGVKRSWTPGLSTRLWFRTVTQAAKHLELQAAEDDVKRLCRQQSVPYVPPVSVVQMAFSDLPVRMAVDQAEREIKTLRACVNILGMSSFHIQSSATWTPSYEFPASPFLLLFDKRGHYVRLYHDPATLFFQQHYKTKPLRRAHFEKALDLLRELRSLADQIRDAVVRPLVLFQEGLDVPFSQAALLGMWRALESVPYRENEKRIEYDTLIRVVSALFGPGTERARCVSAILQSLRRKRNDYVHMAEGQGIDDLDCSWLRRLLRGILLGLVDVAGDFDDLPTLREFIRRYGQLASDLSMAEEEARRVLAAAGAIRVARKL